MSLPSLTTLLNATGKSSDNLTGEQMEAIFVEAMRRDLPLACDYLHKQSHLDGDPKAEDPKSELGRQLTRISFDVLRTLAEKHLCHGKPITFYNCCKIAFGERPPFEQMMRTQIQCQAGPIAYSDC